ncbi:MAG TPA: D-2-hydroxyacid dehydrogenase [Longimicrobiales bacterium]|nr:D-2-hydroxyacid dehydrogenase [Longimicrobiales bacterium]
MPQDTILIASWLEPEHVARIRAAATHAEVIHEPDLLRPPRYAADHKGEDVTRTPEQEARWRELLGRATILFDFDMTHVGDLPELAPNVRWIQATSAGIGQFVRRTDYARRMPGTVFTTASGVHARPLAEFVLLCMLGHVRGLLPTVHAQRLRHWERFAGTDLEGRTALVVGYGKIGVLVGRMASAFGVTVLGVKGRPDGADPATLNAHEIHGPDALHELLPRADFLVLAAPHTDETEGMIDATALAALPAGAALINIGRGALVDEAALVAALASGQLGGAYLDVFETEPLPVESPLWDMPNVLVSPHSGSTSDRENGRITDLFCENLRRREAGEPLLNVLDPERLY